MTNERRDEPDTFQSLGDVAKKVVRKASLNRDARFRHLTAVVCAFGERPVGEILSEIAAAYGLEADIMGRLEQYAKIDPARLAALGGEHWPSPHDIGGGK